MPRYTADDFGLCESVDHAILELARAGALTGASVLVTHCDPRRLAELGAIDGFEIGLHLNLTEGRCLSAPVDASSLTTRDGDFLPVRDHVWRFLRRELVAAAVVTEVAAQYDHLKALVGRVDFIDGHQHVQYLPPVLDALLRVIRSDKRSTERVRFGQLVAGAPSVRTVGLGALARLGRARHPELGAMLRRRVVDYPMASRDALRPDDDVMLHVAHPEFPDPSIGGTYPWQDRVAQFAARMAEVSS